jgi:hypothetical protein
MLSVRFDADRAVVNRTDLGGVGLGLRFTVSRG